MARALFGLGTVRSSALASLVAVFTAACGSDTDPDPGGGAAGGPGGEPARFSVMLEPTSLSLPRGASASITVTIEREDGFVDPVAIRFEGLPEGWASDTLTLPDGVSSGSLAVASSLEGTEDSVELDAMASSGSQRASAELSLDVVASEPSSQEKIRAALADGSLDYETSLLYRAYALFGEARLPEEFAGAGSEEEDNGLWYELRRGIDELSSDAQGELRPFLVRPAEPDSIWNTDNEKRAALRFGTRSFTPGSAPHTCAAESSAAGSWMSRPGNEAVRVWAQCQGDPAADAESARLVDETLSLLDKIYAPMTSLLTVPIGDEEGEDPSIDFYIVGSSAVQRAGGSFRPVGLGSTYNDAPEIGNGASAFVTLPRSLLYTSRFHTTLIHEFFHVLENAYNYSYAHRESSTASNVFTAHWFPEAAAVWASAHFDRTLAPWPAGRAGYLDAHRRFACSFQTSGLALTAPNPVPHTYAAYIWPYFVEQAVGSPTFMPRIWEGLVDVTTWEAADDAISAVHPFDEHFKEFALKNLNQPFLPGDPLPQSERYITLDPLFPDDRPPRIERAHLAAGEEYRHALPIPNLAARYIELTPHPNTRKVEFDFSNLQPEGSVDIQALLQTLDGWVTKPIDLSDETRAVFCFDNGPTTQERRGSFTTALLIISNHAQQPDDEVTGDLIVKPTTDPCKPVWQGTVTVDYRYEDDLEATTQTSTATLVFEYDPAGQTPLSTTYRLTGGTYTYDSLAENKVGACQTHNTATGTITPSDRDAYLDGTPGASYGELVITHGTPRATYTAEASTVGEGVTTSTCNDGKDPVETSYVQNLFWLRTPLEGLEVSEDGMTIEGEYDDPAGMGSAYRYEWELQQIDE